MVVPLAAMRVCVDVCAGVVCDVVCAVVVPFFVVVCLRSYLCWCCL